MVFRFSAFLICFFSFSMYHIFIFS
jgi:hypothetical protein